MVSKAALVLCLLCATQSFAAIDMSVRVMGRSLFQEELPPCILSRPRGSIAVASANVQAFQGMASAHVSATGEALEEATNAIAETVTEAVVEVAEGGTADAIADAVADAYARAVATAYTNVVVEISSTGEDNTVCASAFSDASATATAFARAAISILAQASNAISFASADGAAEALSVATAEAFSESEANACGEGVFDASVETENLAQAIVEPYARLFSIAFAAVQGGTAVADIIIEAEAGTIETSFSDGTTAADIEGPVSGSAGSGGCAATEQRDDLCPLTFRACCLRPTSDCRCGASCMAVPADPEIFGAGSVTGFEVTVASGDLAVGDVCTCPP